MRALPPLIAAAALAVAGWLASGVVTVRSSDEPARFGLLPPVSSLLFHLAAMLALAALAQRARKRPEPERTNGERGLAGDARSRPYLALLALIPIALPWLPVPLPPVALICTGPLAVAWWLACVAYAYADVWSWLLNRASPLLQPPNRAPMVAAVLTGVALAAVAVHTASQHPKGDEPDYLIITQSLLFDRDLQIANNHARADYASYHREVLAPSYLQRGSNGAIYSVHAPGLAAALVPGFALAGHVGAIATLVFAAMAGAWLAWRTCWQLTGSTDASWIGTLATVGAAPFFLHAAAIFPDAPASVLVLIVVGALLDEVVALDDAAFGKRNSTCFEGRRPNAEGQPWRWAGIGLVLGVLPWLHTRYAILAAGLGGGVVCFLALRARWRELAAFIVVGAVAAATWLGFFALVYGTPNPSAPYGAYTQMALAHLAPGLPGLLIDQQFGLLASAPVLSVAVVALRRQQWRNARAVWAVALLIVGLACAYTVSVGAYRMWWGGLSAPARFLVPIVLPLAPCLALAWQSLTTRASRHLVLGLLFASLALTAALSTVDHGALAYNVRDGAARWALWASPLVDLVSALPAAHRDAPAVVLRDGVVWVGFASAGWLALRTLERCGALTPVAALVLVAVLVPAASTVAWSLRGAHGLAPASSQVNYLERRANQRGAALWTITRPPVGRTHTSFDVEIDAPGRVATDAYSVLVVRRLPAGRYHVHTTIAAPGARLGVTLGTERATRFLAELAPASGVTSVPLTLPVPVEGLIVRGSREATLANGRTWITADEVWPPSSVLPATRIHTLGGRVWLLPQADVFPEAERLWLAGDADVTLGIEPDAPIPMVMRAGDAEVEVTASGMRESRITLGPGATQAMLLSPVRGRVRLQTRGGFRPSQSSSGSNDQRWLGIWIETTRK